MRRAIAIALVATMVLSTVLVMSVPGGASDDGRASGTVPAPKWKQGNMWKWQTTTVPPPYTWDAYAGPTKAGTVTMTYTSYSDTKDLTVSSVNEAQYRHVDHETTTQNDAGNWVFNPDPGSGYQTSSGTFTESSTETADRTRSTDTQSIEGLAIIDERVDWTSSQTFTKTGGSGPGINGFNGNGHYEGTFNPADNQFQFPLATSASWTVNSEETLSAMTSTSGGTTATCTGCKNTFNYAVTVDGSTASKTTPKGTYDSFGLQRSGTETVSGTWTAGAQTAPRTGSIGINTKWWYAAKVGYIVDFNGTLPLTDFSYVGNEAPMMGDVNGVPGVDPGPLSFREDTTLSLNINVSDVDLPGGTGGGDDSLSAIVKTVSSTASQTWLTANMPLNASAPQGNPPQVTFSLSHLATAADVGSYSVKFQISDMSNEKAYAWVNFTIDHVNHAPKVLKKMTDLTMDENSTKIVTEWTLDRIFTDPDWTSGWVGGTVEPLNFTVKDNQSIMVSIEPKSITKNDLDQGTTSMVTLSTPDYWVPSGVVKMTFTASDGRQPTVSTTVNITVRHVNHRPVLASKATKEIFFDEDMPAAKDVTNATISLKDMFSDDDRLKYATAIDPTPTYTATISPSSVKWLKVTIDPVKETATLKSDPNMNGEVDITFKVKDSPPAGTQGDPAEASNTVHVTVRPVNDAPQIDMNKTDPAEAEVTTDEATQKKFATEGTDIDFTTTTGIPTTLTYTWYVGDKDVPEDSLVSAAYKQKGSAKEFTFIPQYRGANSADRSPYKIRVVVADSFGATSSFTWTLTVTNVNRKPVAKIVAPSNGTSFREDRDMVFSSGDNRTTYDLDQDDNSTLTFEWRDRDSNTVIYSGTGPAGASFSYKALDKAKKLKTGKHTIVLKVTDGDATNPLSSDEASVEITIQKKPAQVGGGVVPGFEGVLLAVAAVAGVLLFRRRRM